MGNPSFSRFVFSQVCILHNASQSGDDDPTASGGGGICEYLRAELFNISSKDDCVEATRKSHICGSSVGLLSAPPRIAESRGCRRCPLRPADKGCGGMVDESKIRGDKEAVLGGRCCLETGEPAAVIPKLGHGEEAVQFDQGEGGKGRANPHKYALQSCPQCLFLILRSGCHRSCTNDTTSTEPRSPLHFRLGMLLRPHNHKRSFSRLWRLPLQYRAKPSSETR